MFRLVEKKNNNYLILDTDDGVIEELNYLQILEYLEQGIEIEGCVKTTKGYHFEIDNFICDKSILYKNIWFEDSTAKFSNNKKNLIGSRFENLYVETYAYTDRHGKNYICKCDCGIRKIYRGSTLTSGLVKGCGCQRGKSNKGIYHKERALSHIGEKWGRLKIIDIVHAEYGYNMICECECGSIKSARYQDLSLGKVVSCGCYLKEIASINGLDTGVNNIKHNYNWYFLHNGNKIRCRSGYEVIFANYLIESNISFHYEKIVLKTKSGLRYLPDFYLPETNMYIEIKGFFSQRQSDKIDELANDFSIKVLFWDDIVNICKLKYKCYSTFLRHADKLKVNRIDYLAYKLYA